MNSKILILDIDGVLITTPTWKADEIDSDGYSKFNMKCVDNLNKLLSEFDFKIWLSSTRRTVKNLEEFNLIFAHRKIKKSIAGFLPDYKEAKNRKEEIERFINDLELKEFLIIDDDKSLNGIIDKYKERLVLTEFMKGFDNERLEFAQEKIKKHNKV